MTNPAGLIDEINTDVVLLDEIDKAAKEATDLLNQAEEAWLEIYDRVAEDLKSEMEEQGRKGDPAEHTIASVARRSNRVAYTNWRRARRAVELVDKRLQARKAALFGRQTELRALSDEARAPQARAPQPQPQWSRRVA